MRAARIVALAVALGLGAADARALETDPFWAWGRPIADSTDALNARVDATIDAELARIGERRDGGAGLACFGVAKRVARRFRLFLYSPLELWALHSPEVGRAPATPEEDEIYRASYVYATTPLLDPVRWLPPTPTIDVNGVRIGTDKLTHFFSEGWMQYRWYRRFRRKGVAPEAAVQRALGRGLLVERTVLGGSSSGVVSIADLEANERGVEFFRGLCEGDEPMLAFDGERWERTRPFDFRDWVTPEWDESWQPSVYGGRRWRLVREVLLGYCDELASPEVAARRRAYAERDVTTPTERFIAGRVAAGKLLDPDLFSIERLCSADDGSRP